MTICTHLPDVDPAVLAPLERVASSAQWRLDATVTVADHHIDPADAVDHLRGCVQRWALTLGHQQRSGAVTGDPSRDCERALHHHIRGVLRDAGSGDPLALVDILDEIGDELAVLGQDFTDRWHRYVQSGRNRQMILAHEALGDVPEVLQHRSPVTWWMGYQGPCWHYAWSPELSDLERARLYFYAQGVADDTKPLDDRIECLLLSVEAHNSGVGGQGHMVGCVTPLLTAALAAGVVTDDLVGPLAGAVNRIAFGEATCNDKESMAYDQAPHLADAFDTLDTAIADISPNAGPTWAAGTAPAWESIMRLLPDGASRRRHVTPPDRQLTGVEMGADTMRTSTVDGTEPEPSGSSPKGAPDGPHDDPWLVPEP